jgi:hypothetical protein
MFTASSVLAQRRGGPVSEEPQEKNYVPSYMIIMFMVGLGLMLICRSGKRTIDFRRD